MTLSGFDKWLAFRIVLATTIGMWAGTLVAAMLAITPIMFGLDDQGAPTLLGNLWLQYFVIYGLTLGLILGVAQQLSVRRSLGKRHWLWPVLTTVGTSSGTLLVFIARPAVVESFDQTVALRLVSLGFAPAWFVAPLHGALLSEWNLRRFLVASSLLLAGWAAGDSLRFALGVAGVGGWALLAVWPLVLGICVGMATAVAVHVTGRQHAQWMADGTPSPQSSP